MNYIVWRLASHLHANRLVAVLVMAALFTATQAAAAPDLVRREFHEVDTLLANPGQGWMSQLRSPRGEPRFPFSVVYIRFDWASAEPEEGKFNWKLIDDVIAAWKPEGAAVALRVMTCNAHSSSYYTSPEWLFDAGCKGHEYLRGGDDPTSGGKRILRIEPDYSDPIYLRKHGAFLKALGERYDGHPNVEFLDIGSYGIWGEWHTSHPAPVAVRKQIVDLYLNAFKKTPLVFMSDDAEVLGYALSRGTGFRRDGVGSPWHERNWIGSKKYGAVQGMGEAWKSAPIVFEWFGNFAYLQSRQWPFDAAVDFMLSNHVTLINDNIGEVPPEKIAQLEKLARLAGARFVLRELVHKKLVRPGSALNLKMHWSNVGVGKLYRPYTLSICLLDRDGRVAFTAKSTADPRDWLPGDHAVAETLDLPPTLKPDDYTIAVSLVSAMREGAPFRLAIDVPQKQGCYELSKVTVDAGLPIHVDLRPELRRMKLTQRRQGKRGTCSVFATDGALEFAVARATGKTSRLSVEFANWAANAATGRQDDGDFFHNIIRGIEKHGICEESAMAYAQNFSPTNAPSQDATTQARDFRENMSLSFHWIKRWSRKAGLDAHDLRQIKSALAAGNPVSAGSYHSVLFVGYEDDPQAAGGGRFFVSDSNLAEREITYEAAGRRMSDLFWVEATAKRK
jgi:hypothetical protein